MAGTLVDALQAMGELGCTAHDAVLRGSPKCTRAPPSTYSGAIRRRIGRTSASLERWNALNAPDAATATAAADADGDAENKIVPNITWRRGSKKYLYP